MVCRSVIKPGRNGKGRKVKVNRVDKPISVYLYTLFTLFTQITMRIILQRVTRGSVTVAGRSIAEIGPGLVILLGIGPGDGDAQIDYLVKKMAHLRIFEDSEGKMNLSVLDVGGQAIVVSQFTLYANTHKGRRPSFTRAAPPEIASPLVDRFAERLAAQGVPTQIGEFGAHMQVEIHNDGPVTIWMER